MTSRIVMTLLLSLLSGTACVSGPKVPSPAREVTPAKQELNFETNKIAADLGSDQAQLKAAQALLAGKGVKKNPAQAVEYFQKSADAGNAEAQARLAMIYLQGKVVPKDREKALELTRKSIEQGHALGHYAMAMSFAVERPVDYKKEYEWTLKAAELGSLSAQSRLAEMYRDGEGVTKNRFRGMEWTEKAAEAGHASAQYDLGYAYRNGYVKGRNSKKAEAWFQACAEQKQGRCFLNLAELYQSGDFGEEKRQKVQGLYREAVAVFEKDARDGQSYAFFALGKLYREGQELPKNPYVASGMYAIGLKLSRLHYPEHAQHIADMQKDLSEAERAEVKRWGESWTEGSALPGEK